jgi:hypothetical protein
MAKKARWEWSPTKNGTAEVTFFSWKYFHDFVRQKMLPYSHYVWRGQRDANWKLESSLDRLLKRKKRTEREWLAEEHLRRFKLSVRGRRGPNPASLVSENDWWALGQHHSLATPLLDWTDSAFVALYFAFEKSEKSASGHRAVWALGGIGTKVDEIRAAHTGATRPPIIEHIRPTQDENSRLVSQGGLFTRAPLGVTVDQWIETNYAGPGTDTPLLKLKIPDEDRFDCLRTLNKMNINHVSLFPDLYGSGQHCNKALEINKY